MYKINITFGDNFAAGGGLFRDARICLLYTSIENQSANTVVILPQDNTLEVTMRRLADSGIPFVMFDRVIDSVSEQAVALSLIHI